MEPAANVGHESAKTYLIGFALALVLTAIPFSLVAMRALPRSLALIVIAFAAVLQILVHLRYFLHLDLKSRRDENLLAIAFAAVLVFIMIGGTLWIMLDLHQRMAM
jgi:cytochrome o ubiquinol oxidase subunit IV